MTAMTRGAVLPGRVPKLGRGKVALLIVLVLLMLVLAWLDGGERALRPIEQDIPVPEGAL
jgi:hypothetical protein